MANFKPIKVPSPKGNYYVSKEIGGGFIVESPSGSIMGSFPTVKEAEAAAKKYAAVVHNSTSFQNGRQKALNALGPKLQRLGNAKLGEKYHVEKYAEGVYYVEDAVGGDSSGPFPSEPQAIVERIRRNKGFPATKR